MSRHLYSPILVWVLLQMIYLFQISMQYTKSLDEHEFCKIFHPGERIYFTQNLTAANEWNSSYFPHCTIIIALLPFKILKGDEFRKVVRTQNLNVENQEFMSTQSSTIFCNVKSIVEDVNISELALLSEKIRQYAEIIHNRLEICSCKLVNLPKCSNVLSKQVIKDVSKLNSIRCNNGSGFVEIIMQTFCMIDGDCYLWVYESMYKSRKGIPWIYHHNFTIVYFGDFACTYIFEDPWKLNPLIICCKNTRRNLTKAFNSLITNFHDFKKNNPECNTEYLKETTRDTNDDLFKTKLNSRQNRYLLSVDPDSNIDEREPSIDKLQKVRYVRSKKVQSMSNQRDHPNENLYASKIERRRKRKSRRLARDLTSAAEAKRTTVMSSQEADATKRAAQISFSPDNEADYRREIDRQIEADFAQIKDTLRLEKGDAISSETFRWPLSAGAKNNRQLVNQPAAIDSQKPEIIKARGVCTALHCQQVIRQDSKAKSWDSDELPTNSRGNAASKRNGIAALAPQKVIHEKAQPGNDERKLVGEALIILNKNASPFSIIRRSDDAGVNLKYSVESISLGLDELLKMGKEVMKVELDKAAQNETKRAGLSCRNCLKYAKGNNETYRGLEDDEGTKLEEELKELRSMHIQRRQHQQQQGFANSGKNEMRFAAGDEYILRKDENARLNNAYSSGHVRKRRCHKKRKSPRRSNKITKVTPNRNSYHKVMKNDLQTLDDVSFGYNLANNEIKASSRVKKSDPYREYEEPGVKEKLFSDTKVIEHSRSKRKTSRATLLSSNHKEVIERKIQTPADSREKTRKKSKHFIVSDISRKSQGIRSHKITKKSTHKSKPLSINQLMDSPRSKTKMNNKLSQSLSSRKLKSVEVGRMPREVYPVSKSDTHFKDINNIYYYDNDDLQAPIVSLDQAVENRNMKVSGLKRKLLSLNSMEYDEGSPISANEESNCDYVEKFYGDQRYEIGSAQLNYSQINLKNVTLPENTGTRGKGLGIELAQCHANKSMKSIVSKSGFPKRTLKSAEQEENSDYEVKKDSVKSLYLSGDLIGYNYDPEENENGEKFKRESDENVDPDLARLFADGQEYDINVRGKLHLRLKDPQLMLASEKSSKKKRSSDSKIAKSRKKLARTNKKFAVPDKRTKRDPGQESADAHKEDGNPKSKTSNKTRNPLKKISDFFKRKFSGSTKKKKHRKKIYANAKVVRIRPGQDENGSQSTFPPSDQSTTTPESRRDNCKCAQETTTTTPAPESTSVEVDTFEPTDITQPDKAHETITENNDSNYGEYTKPDSCHCGEKSTEMSFTQQYATNRPESDYSSTKAQLSHEIVSEESPESITTTGIISTSGQPEKATVIPSNSASTDSSPEQKAKMKNALEILNFIKKLENLVKDQKGPLRIGDKNGGIEIKLEKIYTRSGKSHPVVELKDVSDKDQKSSMPDEDDTSKAIHQADNNNGETSISSMPNGNVRGKRRKNTQKNGLNEKSQISRNVDAENDVNENNVDQAGQAIEKSNQYNKAIMETYIEASVPKSSPADKNSRNNKSLPAKQWIDEQRIAPNDQSSSRDRKRKKWRRKKRRHTLRKRTVNETGIATKKGEPPYRLQRRRRRRRRRRRLSNT